MRPTLIVLTIGALLSASAAQAHPRLLSSAPAQDAAVPAPTSLELTFSEQLEPKFSKVTLVKPDGGGVRVASKVTGKDRKSMSAKPAQTLAPGPYRVNWQAVASDGHKMTGSYNFVVK
jgi:copper resistance protein C